MTDSRQQLQDKIGQWRGQFKDSTPEQVLKFFLGTFGRRIALASSMGLEDQVLTDMILSIDGDARIFTIDTGRLYPETYELIDATCERYNHRIEVYFPDSAGVEKYVSEHGINGFYMSVELRKACCRARKIEPLERALGTLDVWICGLRRGQAVTRSEEQMIEWDGMHGLVKLNPLVDYSESQVWEYIKKHKVPYNRLHDQNFPSIGCAPCTRAVKEGEDIRAGRWWWESPEHKECGLHRR